METQAAEEAARLEALITSPHCTAFTASVLALRDHRTNAVAFKFAKLPLGITRKVELLLTVARLKMDQARREEIIGGLLHASQLKGVLDQIPVKQAQLEAALEVAQSAEEQQVILEQLQALVSVARDVVQRLEAMEGGQNGE